MAGFSLDRVHERESHLDPQTGEQRLRVTKINPYMLLSVGGHPNIFLQSGQAWYEGGQNLDPPYPDWLLTEIARCTPRALREVGWGQSAPVPHRSELLSRLAHLSEEDLDVLLSLTDQLHQAGGPSAPLEHESPLPESPDDDGDISSNYDALESVEMAHAEQSAPSFVEALLRR
jgi:hypothetical protein